MKKLSIWCVQRLKSKIEFVWNNSNLQKKKESVMIKRLKESDFTKLKSPDKLRNRGFRKKRLKELDSMKLKSPDNKKNKD